MNDYEFVITETLSRVIKIKSKSEEEAKKIIEELYRTSQIVLSADDFIGVEIKKND